MMTRAGGRQIQIRPPVPQGGGQQRTVDEMRSKVNAFPWIMYDTRVFGNTAYPGDSSAQNFAQIATPLQFFNTQQRLLGTQNGAFCSNSDVGKMDMDFVCHSIGVDVKCETDVPSTAGIATAAAFCETVVHFGVLRIDFASDPVLLLPLTELPSGGGIWEGAKTRHAPIGVIADSATANNGLPSFEAVMRLSEPLVFPKGQPFTTNIHLMTDQAASAGPLARLQALPALSGNFNAVIRLKFRGVRGKPLLLGVTQNPELRHMWAGYTH